MSPYKICHCLKGHRFPFFRYTWKPKESQITRMNIREMPRLWKTEVGINPTNKHIHKQAALEQGSKLSSEPFSTALIFFFPVRPKMVTKSIEDSDSQRLSLTKFYSDLSF